VKTIFCLIALLLPAGDVCASADEPKAPASPAAIVAYHDSGEWRADTARTVRRARRFLARHLDDRRPAIVLDIDDTSLSNYHCLKAVDFDRPAADCVSGASLPAIPQTLRLYRYARSHQVTVFFVTGRREKSRAPTVKNLRRAGYSGRLRLRMRPDRERPGTHDGWKARTRAAIARRGYRIVANLGDQRSDLDGGRALRAFKLPNPMYVIPTA
jgi:predicted secreted acid phosphatase